MKTNRRILFLYGLTTLIALCAYCVIARAERWIIYEKDSEYNHIVVKEDDEGLRYLLFERYGALQSVVKPGDPNHVELPYARAMNLGLIFVKEPRDVLIIGLGGGTIPNFLHRHYPEAAIDVVDIDPEVVAVAMRFFGFQEDGLLRVHVADGRKFVQEALKQYDIVYLDAYGPDSIPFHLATCEFLREVRRILTPGGIVVGNLWSRESNHLYDSMVRTYQEVFDELYIFDVQDSRNKIFVGVPRKGKSSKEDLARRGAEISGKGGFRFDLREMVNYGYHYATKPKNDAPPLNDKKSSPKEGGKEKASSGSPEKKK